VLQLSVHGRWSWSLTRAVRTCVNKCLAQHPSAVIIDLHASDGPNGSSAAPLVMAYRAGQEMQPPVPIAICVAPGSDLEARLRTTGAARFLPLFCTVPQARAALDRDLVVPDHMQLNLRPLRRAPEQARRLVAEAARGWALPQLVHPAELAMSELVTNAVQHAGTDILVTVSRRPSGIYLAVRDGSTVLPPQAGGSDAGADARPDEYGFGLWLVDQIAAAWGALPTHERPGKVVWATVRPGVPRRRTGNSEQPPPTPYLHIGAAEPMAQGLLSPLQTELSSREQEILSYLPTMLTRQEIATHLHVSVDTVKAHLKSIYRKLGVPGRRGAVSEAIRRGLL
jgi:DNA-binding CsgD family transcriptional regulator